MSNKITIASAALLTVALLGVAAPTANAQLFGGLHLNTGDFSLSLGTGYTCNQAPVFRYETVRRKVWRPATWRIEHVPAVYRTEYDCFGNATQILVRTGYDRRIRVAGHWDFVTERVKVRRPCNRCERWESWGPCTSNSLLGSSSLDRISTTSSTSRSCFRRTR